MFSRHAVPRMLPILAAAVAVTLLATAATPAQDRLEPLELGVVYDIPATQNVKLVANVPYWKDARDTLAIDIYQPPGLKRGETRPVVVFLNSIGDAPGGQPLKTWGIYRTWPRLVAAHGMVGVSMEANGERVQECLSRLFTFLETQGAPHGIDGSRAGVYAASANVRGAWAFLNRPDAPRSIKAAALYYGNPPDSTVRMDLPVLFVVAASDAPHQAAQLDSLWHHVVAQGAPWTLQFGARMPHAFDAFSDNDEARRLIQQTLAFWTSHLQPVPQPPWPHSEERDVMAALYGGNPQAIATVLEPWLATHPRDPMALARYGQALQDMNRSTEAAPFFERAYAADTTNPSVFTQVAGLRMRQGRYPEAVAMLERAVAAGWNNSYVLGQLAFAELGCNRNEAAVRHYEQAFEAGIPPGRMTRGVAYYNLACGYARLGRKQDALDALAKAIDQGSGQGMSDDTDFATIKSEPRFRELSARVVAAPN